MSSQTPASDNLSAQFRGILYDRISSLSPRERTQFEGFSRTTLDDFRDQIERTEKEMGKRHIGKPSPVARFAEVLDEITTMSNDVLNSNIIMPYVWGTCNALLQKMSGDYERLDAFFKEYDSIAATLSEIYKHRIKNPIRSHKGFARAFFCDQILEFHASMFGCISDTTFESSLARELSGRNRVLKEELEYQDDARGFSKFQEIKYLLRSHERRDRWAPSKWASAEFEEVVQKSKRLKTTGTVSGTISTAPDLTTTVSVIQHWIDHCSGEHTACYASRNPVAPLPTRVIEVGSDDASIRLIETQGRSGCYAALTYCWGNSYSNYLTTMDTLSQNIKNIPWRLLPKTVYDAIQVTRSLGIRYLWVDALCIIQSTNDWEIEAGRIASVYLNAHITISAASAADCAEGFLHRCWLPDRKTEAMDGTRALSKCNWEHDSRTTYTRELPIFRRAWTFQELLLSRRTVLFADNALIWLCKKRGIYADSRGLVDNPSVLIGLTGFLTGFGNKILLSQFTWWSWIGDYTGRDLTYESDRMAAIAGITDYYATQTCHTPVLGLWKEHLLHDLLWRAVKPRRTAHSHLRLPTWSWLAHVGSISLPTTFFTHPFKATADLLHYDVTWEGEPLVGKVQTAKITLRAIVDYYVVRASADHTFKNAWEMREGTRNSISNAGLVLELTMPPLLHGVVTGTDSDGFVAGYCVLDMQEDYARAELGVVLPCIEIGLHEGKDQYREVLLLRHLNEEQQLYERVGVGAVSWEGRERTSETVPAMINLV